MKKIGIMVFAFLLFGCTTTEEESNIKHQILDDIDVYYDDSSVAYNIEDDVDAFSEEMSNILIENHAEISNGAIFRRLGRFTSNGDSFQDTAILVWLSQETIESINFEQWTPSDQSLFREADAIWAHRDFQLSGADRPRPGSDNDETPEVYFTLISNVEED